MDLATVKKLLKNTKKENLLKIIAKLSSYNDEANEWLLDYCKKNAKAEERTVVWEQITHYWSVAERIIDEANEYGGCPEDDEEEAYEALRKIDELFGKNEMPWDFRKKYFDGMMRLLLEDNSGFEDALYDSCTALCQTTDEQLYLADALRESGSDYYKRIAANIYLSCGREDAFLAIRSANLEYEGDYLTLADYYKNHGEHDKAVALAEEALAKADGRMDDVYKWLFDEYRQNGQEAKIRKLYQSALSKQWDADVMVQMMMDYYADDYDRKKEFLLKMPEVCGFREIRKWFDRCRSELRPEDFQRHQKHLYTVIKKRSMADYLQLKIDDGDLQEVFDYLSSCPPRVVGTGIDENHNLSKQLANAYPKEICERYWKECEVLCAHSNKNHYKRAAQILVEIKKICQKHKLMEEWNRTYQAFLEKNKRKPLLMGIIGAEKALQPKQS